MFDHASILDVRGLDACFGGVQALDDLSFTVGQGQIFAIIGPNGAGKTSLFNCISGHRQPHGGRILFQDHDITPSPPVSRADLGIGRTFQNLALFNEMTVMENILVGRHHLMRSNVATGALYWVGGARAEEIDHRQAAEEIMAFLDIQCMRDVFAGTLPYGLRKLVELARAVALRPKLILLDEPMAGMNLSEKRDMAKHIIELNREWNMTVLMIEHDIGVVADISDRVLALEFGRRIALATPQDVLADARVRAAYLGTEVIQV